MDNLAAWQQFAKSFGSKILIGCYFGKNHKCLEHIFWFSFEKAWIVFSSKNTIFFSSLATRCRWQHGGACKTFFKPKVLGTGLLVMQTLSLTSCLSRCGQKETTMSSLDLKPPGWCKYLQAFQDIQQLVARCFLLFPAETPSWFHGSPFMILAQPHDNKCYILSPNLSSCVVMMVAWWGRQDFFCQINAAKFVTLWLWFVYNNELTQTRNNPSKKGVIWHPEKTENNGTQAISLPPADGLLFFPKDYLHFPDDLFHNYPTEYPLIVKRGHWKKTALLDDVPIESLQYLVGGFAWISVDKFGHGHPRPRRSRRCSVPRFRLGAVVVGRSVPKEPGGRGGVGGARRAARRKNWGSRWWCPR